jgi:small subunit ribosomal protein S4
MAAKTPASTGEELLKLLERRLDNVVYRLNFAPTRRSARQMITHGHVVVDDKKMSIPSYLVNEGETIRLSDKAQKIPAVEELLRDKKLSTPTWLDRKAAVGLIKGGPSREDVDLDINEQLIVEHYSR